MREVIHGLGVGAHIKKALSKAAITAIDDASTRLSSLLDGTDPHRGATYGNGVGHDLAKKLGEAAGHAVDSGSTRLDSAIDGSDPSDATYGSGFCKHCGVLKGRHPVRTVEHLYDEMEGGLLKGSAEAKAHAIYMRSKRQNPENYARGTDRAKGYENKNSWIEYVKKFREANPTLTWKECMVKAGAARRRFIEDAQGGARVKRAWAPAKRVDAIE